MHTPVVPIDTLLGRRHIPIFDGIRGIAMFFVIVAHSGLVWVPADLGVSMFFVISGFLITWLLLKEQESTGGISLRDFYVRRTFRIFPAYYAFLAFSLAVDTVQGDRWSAWRIASNFGYFTNYYNAALGHPSNSTAHIWSLAVEEQFYLLWPVAFIALSRLGQQAMKQALLGIVVLVAAWRTFGFVVLDLGPSYAYNAFDTRLDNLAIGLLMAVWAHDPRFVRGALRLVKHWWAPVPTFLLLLASRLLTPPWYHYGPGLTVDALLIAVLFVQLMQLSEARPWKFIDLPLLRWLGTISYPCYLYHQWGLGLGHKFHALSPLGQFLVGLVATIGFGAGSWYVIEKPMLAVRRRFVTGGEVRLATPPGS